MTIIKLPPEIEADVLKYLNGQPVKNEWVKDFLDNGIAGNYNYLYKETYYVLLMKDILKYLIKYYPQKYEEIKRNWKYNLINKRR